MAQAGVRRLYRALMRLNRMIDEDRFALRASTDVSVWGNYHWGKHDPLHDDQQILKDELQLAVLPQEPVTSSRVYRNLVSANFRVPAIAEELPNRLSQAFKALRFMTTQLYLSKCSSRAMTDDVQVDATSWFQMATTDANVFTYRIRITNLRCGGSCKEHEDAQVLTMLYRQQPIKVLGRSWTVKNDDGEMKIHIPLTNNAIVGQQPVIPPGDFFEYHSHSNIDTLAGLQEGRLQVAVLGNGRDKPPTMKIIADVAPFPLIAPDHAAAGG